MALFAGTAFCAESSTSNVTQIASMEPFQVENWGSFWTVDLQGERFFAAYAEGGHLWESSIDADLTKSGQLSRVLIDEVEDRVFTSGTPLELEEGYELAIQSIDLDGNRVFVQLMKEGAVVDSALVEPSGEGADIDDKTYTYTADLGDAEKIAIVAVHFKNSFRGADRDMATVDGIWQISDTLAEIGEGEVRVPQWRNFERDDWGHFYTLEAEGEEYFAVYSEDGCLSDVSREPDLVKHNLLSRIIYDDGQERTFTSGTSLGLEEGYELAIESIDLFGNKVYVELLKDGRVVDAEIIYAGVPGATAEEKTYTYTRDLGGAEDVVTLAVHFERSFRGADQDLATIDGIWQISETPISI
ncbi:MAG TPA: S-layer protein domain-containing protein [Methanothrix sp.]|nr:S-layer protein domain-containing protein [Methanothrix sp.]